MLTWIPASTGHAGLNQWLRWVRRWVHSPLRTAAYFKTLPVGSLLLDGYRVQSNLTLPPQPPPYRPPRRHVRSTFYEPGRSCYDYFVVKQKLDSPWRLSSKLGVNIYKGDIRPPLLYDSSSRRAKSREPTALGMELASQTGPKLV